MLPNTIAIHCLGARLEFCLLPRRCYISNRLLWLRYAYRQTIMRTRSLGIICFESRWCDKNQYLMAKLKGLI